MKKTILFIATIASLSTLTSCWEFNRQQQMKDADANGKSTLIEAESSKKALIEEAKAKNEAATLNAEARIKVAKAEAQAEIERAKGVAEANRIIGHSLQDNANYLKYLQIEAIKESKGAKVYIPTEAGLPILEAK